MALRERCPFAVVGKAGAERNLKVHDKQFHNQPIDLPLSLLFDDTDKMQRDDQHSALPSTPLDTQQIDLSEAIKRVLQYPCVADKSFLITIGDRTVTGLVARDQMVGPWQVPVV